MTRSMQVMYVEVQLKSPRGGARTMWVPGPGPRGTLGQLVKFYIHPTGDNVQWGTKIIVHNDRVISVSVLFSSDSTCFQSERSRNIVYVYYLLLERRE